MKCDESKHVAILCSLDWLNHFIDFFREDFLSVLDRAQAIHNQQMLLQQQNQLLKQQNQESNEPSQAVEIHDIEEEVKGENDSVASSSEPVFGGATASSGAAMIIQEETKEPTM